MHDSLKKLYIEPTSRCNLNCKMCFRKTWVNEVSADMELFVFDRALQTMPDTVETIFFGGMGEPLVHNDILYMVQKAAETGRRVELVTNAMQLSPEMSERLLDAGLNTLWVSIDSFEDKLYGDIRKNSVFSVVKENLRAFNHLRKNLGKPAVLNLTFVVMKSNVHQLAAMPYFVSSYNVSEVNISHAIPTDAASLSEILYEKIIEEEVGAANSQRALPRINVPLMDWRHPGVLGSLNGLFSSSQCSIHLSGQPMNRAQRRCRFVEEGNAFIKHDGSVSPCMALLHSATSYWANQKRTVHHHSFGNIQREGLSAIWQKEEYEKFRDTVRRFEFSPCLRCTPCEDCEQNLADCFGNTKPTCGACLWAEGLINCP